MFGLTTTDRFPFVARKPRVQELTLDERTIGSSPFLESWSVGFEKLPPKTIALWLRMAKMGSLWYQWALSDKMRETWPAYAKCSHELKSAIAGVNYVVHPFSLPNQRPTKSAEAKADLVRRNLELFKPDRFQDEDDAHGMIYDLAGCLMDGISVCEWIWDEKAVSPSGKPEFLIRASAWVHPAKYIAKSDGSFGIGDTSTDALIIPQFNKQFDPAIVSDPQKFIVAKFKSKSGSPLGAGYCRTLSPYWAMVQYPKDFSLNYAQTWGTPFFVLKYEPGYDKTPGNMDKLRKYAKQSQNDNFIIVPSTVNVDVKNEHTLGPNNPHMALMRWADEQCHLLMLGQTLTSTTPENGGTRAQGEVHENVRQEKLEHYARWMGRLLTHQFAESLLIQNYGDDYLANPERPTIAPDMSRPLSIQEKCLLLTSSTNSRIPLPSDPVYKLLDIEQPEPGDEVLVGGQPQLLEETLTPTDKKQQDFEQQLGQQIQIAETQAQLNPEPQQGQPTQARQIPIIDMNHIRTALAQASETEQKELEQLIVKAEKADHPNGEVNAIRLQINRLSQRTKNRL